MSDVDTKVAVANDRNRRTWNRVRGSLAHEARRCGHDSKPANRSVIDTTKFSPHSFDEASNARVIVR
jgi:hypothetical protein